MQVKLMEAGIAYQHFGDALGARRSEPEMFDDDGVVSFEKVRSTKNFSDGVTELVLKVRSGDTVTLVCAESDPLDCHRFSMIAPAFQSLGIDVHHLLKDKSVLTQLQLEQRLIAEFRRRKNTSLALSPLTELDQAYFWKNKQIGFSNHKKR